MEEYILLIGETEFKIMTVLVHVDSYEGEPSDYFVGCPDARKLGTVTIDGDDAHILDSLYNSD